MKLDLITDINTIKVLIQFREPSNFMPPKASITPSEYAPILKRGDQLEQTSFLEPELVYARWGLVPNEYSSLADADRFGLYQTRVESTMRSRTLSKIYPAQRCLIPMMALEMEQTAKLESLTPRLLAGIWTQFVRPLKRVQSFSILTTKNKLGRVAVMLEGEQAQRWLNPITSKRELRALVEGWWAISSFSVNLNLNTITDRAEPRQLE